MINVIYLDLLRTQAEAIGKKRNAPHTKLKLQICAAQIIQEKGYDSVSIAKICEMTNLTRPGFYLHYKNKEKLIVELLKGLLAAEQQFMPSLLDCKHVYDAIERICMWYFSFQIGSAALFSTLNEVHRYIPEASDMRESRRVSLLENLTYQLQRFDKFKAIEDKWGAFVLEMIGQGIYNLAQERALNKDQYVYEVDDVVKLFARMQYQALFCEPVPNEV